MCVTFIDWQEKKNEIKYIIFIMDIRKYFPINTSSQSNPQCRLAIVGSRDFKDYTTFEKYVNDTLIEWNLQRDEITYIVSGGAKGTDTLAEKYASNNNIHMTIYKPDWKQYGKAAGIMRNTDIIQDSDYVIAFPSKSGKGTQDSIRKATASFKKLKVIWID